MLRRLFPVPLFALVDVYSDLKPLRDAVLATAWRDVVECLDQLDRSGDAIVAVRMIGEIHGVEDLLRDATQTLEIAHWLHLLLAARMIKLGQRSMVQRGQRHVSTSQREQAHSEFCLADSLLTHVTAAEPMNIVAATLRMETATWLGCSLEETSPLYDAARKARPNPIYAQHLMLGAMMRNEDLTYAEIHDFALDCLVDAPYGAMQGVLVADAHLREWSALGPAYRDDYFRQASVLERLRNAASRSVGHPAFGQRHGWVWAHNVFAMAWSLAGDKAAARVHFETLGMRISRDPWNLYRDVTVGFMSARTAALGWFR